MNSPSTSRLLTLWQAVLLLNAACVFAIAAESAHVAFLVFFGGLLAIALRPALAFNSRRVIYGAVIVFGITTVETQVFPDPDGTFFLEQTRVFVPALLYAGTALLFFAQRRFVPPLITSFGLLILLMSGAVISLPPMDPSGLIPPVVTGHFRVWYRCAVGLQVFGMVMVFDRYVKHRQRADCPLPIRFRWLFMAALLLVFVTARIGERVALFYEPQLNGLYMRFMQLYLRNRAGRVIFDEEVNLWRTSIFRSEADKTILLRAFSKTAPGYLRARVYRRYRQGVWTTDSPVKTLSPTPAEGMGSYEIYRRQMPGNVNTSEWISLLPEVQLESEALFIPGTAYRMELIAESISHSADGVVTHVEWDQQAGYKLKRTLSADGAYPLPAVLEKDDRAAYLTLDDDQLTSLAPFVQEAAVNPRLPDRIRIQKTVQYLQSRCSYALGIRYNRGRGDEEGVPDPVFQFLGPGRQGHCELFATAGILMLRAQNIPARYVTGLVCQERLGGYWVARLEHAHAWAEAYDADLKQWVLVEPTPPAGIPGKESRSGWLETCLDVFFTYLRAGLTRIRRGELAGVIVDAFGGAWTGAKWLVRKPLFWVLLTLLGGMGFKTWRDKKQKGLPADPDMLALHHLWIRMERWGARHGIQRAAGETVAEFSGRVQQAVIPDREHVVRCLKRYEALRYHEEMRTSQAIEQLRDDWRKIARRKLWDES